MFNEIVLARLIFDQKHAQKCDATIEDGLKLWIKGLNSDQILEKIEYLQKEGERLERVV